MRHKAWSYERSCLLWPYQSQYPSGASSVRAVLTLLIPSQGDTFIFLRKTTLKRLGTFLMQQRPSFFLEKKCWKGESGCKKKKNLRFLKWIQTLDNAMLGGFFWVCLIQGKQSMQMEAHRPEMESWMGWFVIYPGSRWRCNNNAENEATCDAGGRRQMKRNTDDDCGWRWRRCLGPLTG